MRRLFLYGLVLSVCLFGALLPRPFVSSASAQINSGMPSQNYYAGLIQFYGADYRDAARTFERGYTNTAYRFGEKRYLDSVCYLVMWGECNYHSGNYGDALELYERALSLYMTQLAENWQARIQPPTTIQVLQNVQQRTRITWGTPSRRAQISNIPDTMLAMFGRLDASRVFEEGGTFNPAESRRVNVREIMRCTALAIHRRRNILGPTAKHYPFTSNLVTNLSTARANTSLFRSWNSVLLGLAQSAMEDYPAAKRNLAGALQFNSGMDHNLTPIALLELAHIFFSEGNRNEAASFALEASYSAAVFKQYDLIEESLSLGTTVHLMRSKSVYGPLRPAIQWAQSERARLLNTSLIERLATCYVEAGDPEAASQTANQARQPMRSTTLNNAVVASRLQFVSAQTAFLEGNFGEGMNELASALKSFEVGSLWLFQFALADQLVLSGDISGRTADQLYAATLRDPSAVEWTVEPFECLSFLKKPHVEAMERWFELKLLNKQYDKALELSELVRRHRFFSTLPMGGRLLAFRWMLEAPKEALSEQAQTQRVDFLNGNTTYREISDRTKVIRAELAKLPIKPDAGSDELKAQTDLFVELAKLSKQQEAIIASYAVRRVPADFSFPAQRDISSYLKTIQPHQIAFVSLETSSGMHTFLVSSERFKYLGTSRSRDVKSAAGKMLKALGLQDPSGGVEAEVFADESWKVEAYKVAKSIHIDSTEFEWSQDNRYKELVVVPDGVLWYVPFELLQNETAANAKVGALDPANAGQDVDAAAKKPKKKTRKGAEEIDPAKLAMIGDQIQVRYSPTLFTAFGLQWPSRTLKRSAIMSNRMHPKGEVEYTQEMVTKLQTDIPDAASFADKMRIPSNYLGAVLDRMVVYSDLKMPARGGPFALAPAEVDRGLKEGSTLGSWLSFPFWAPEHVVLPGYTSGAAFGSRSKGRGEELFLTSCGLLAAGTRSIMISRWRVGGENSMEIAGGYAKRLGEMSGVRALRESIEEARELDLTLEKEPRIKAKKMTQPMKANHPFFWAGHMVIEIPNLATNKDPDEKEKVEVDAAQADDPDADPVLPGDPDMKDDPDQDVDKDGDADADKKDDDSKKDSKDKAPESKKEDDPNKKDSKTEPGKGEGGDKVGA